MLSEELLKILACPRCKSSLRLDLANDGLVCQECSVLYPVKDDVPVLLEEESIPLEGGSQVTANSKKIVVFEVIEGNDQGQKVKLPVGTCKAIGRSIEDMNKTQVFSMDFTASLDDFTKKVIMNYVSERTTSDKKSSSPTSPNVATAVTGEGLGHFKRLPDLVLNDPAISRLHAMIFHDANGAGVLDLVSKNGTYVGGQEVENCALDSENVVEVGGTKIKVTIQ